MANHTGSARVLIVGSGGREHALGAAMAASPNVGSVVFAGGDNAGLEAIAEHVPPAGMEREAGSADLVVIGPEQPLADGLADRLRARGIAVFGPSAMAARLEASKAYTKELCLETNVPTARASVCGSLEDGLAAVRRMGAPVVVKADGLAAGKGVVVAMTLEEAERAVAICFDGAFGAAGSVVVVEEFMSGPEASLFVLSDGITVRTFAPARDYKRAFDHDAGPNTGGMGAISPAPDLSGEAADDATDRIVRPVLAQLAARQIPFVGVLYAGLMLTREGPKLVEFNVRFGDPECQVMLERLETDPFELMLATATGRLEDVEVRCSAAVSVGVVVAADNYPGAVRTGEPIGGLDAVAAAGAKVFHAGTRREGGLVVSNGGRVLTAVASRATQPEARAAVYGALAHLQWPGGRMRSDIGA